ncbi:helveticin J family class III bacteriocin [Lentilactobacillus raoultii]|uniref:Helveticin J family class III bacteriocin n=1 Tax=Lentilactobacillus raoultii TaxID=1987503 RepID=A0ABW3PD40_9LACO|nr:helveticin J family class III bacteriocin [Lentilactobacillus raoultii]
MSSNIDAHLKYRFKGLPKQNVVQKVYVGSTYVYALQLFNANTDVVISRVRKDSASGFDLDFSNAEKMYLKNFGHGQTFEYFSYNGQAYWWIVTKGAGGSENWGTQVGRIQFEPNTEATTPYNGNTSITRLSALSTATTTGKAYGHIKRVETALSSTNAPVSGGTTDRLLLLAGIDTNNNGHFTLYDNDKVNAMLDTVAANHGHIPCSELKSALVSDPYRKVANLASRLTSNSVQGYDISDGRAIYISSGQPKQPGRSSTDTPGISKFYWGDSHIVKHSLRNTNWKGINTETEGIQIASDLYVGIAYHNEDASATKGNRLYTTTKSSW